MAIFLKLHRISQRISWFQVAVAFLVGMSFQAAAVDYLDDGKGVPLISDVGEALGSFNVSSNITETVSGPSLRDLALNPEKYEGETITVTGQKAIGDVLRTEKGAHIALDCSEYTDSIALTIGESYTVTGEVRSRQEYAGIDFDTGETEYTKEYYLFCTQPPK